MDFTATKKLIKDINKMQLFLTLSGSMTSDIYAIVFQSVEEGKSFEDLHKELQDKFKYDLPFEVYAEAQRQVLGEDVLDSSPNVITHPEGSEGDFSKGYGGMNTGVFIAPVASKDIK